MSTLRVLLADPVSAICVKRLCEGGVIETESMPAKSPKEALCKKLQEGFDALVVRSATRADRDVIKAGLPRLRAIGRAGVGVDNVDLDAATGFGVAVMNVPDANTVSAAEHTLALMLALARNVPRGWASFQEGKWERSKFTGTELRGKTLGLVGLGRIGTLVATAAQALGMRVLAHDPYIPHARVESLGVEMAELDALLKESDFVSMHVPKSDATRNLMNAERLALMKPTARLINCARGGVVDEEALYDAIKNGRLAGAAFDVYEKEPPEMKPLYGLPNVVTTPHLGASTSEAQEKVGVQIAERLRKFLLEGSYEDALNVPFRRLPEEGKPFFDLAERMGALHFQLMDEPAKSVCLEYCGEELGDLKPYTCAYLKGLLNPMTEGGVNLVNALPRASERGIAVEETHSHKDLGYANLIRATFADEAGAKHTLAGCLLEHSLLRLVEINGYRVDVEPKGVLILTENQDVPGSLGSVASLLGKHKINIGECRFGRKERSGSALTVLALDEEAPESVLAALKELPTVQNVRQVRL